MTVKRSTIKHQNAGTNVTVFKRERERERTHLILHQTLPEDYFSSLLSQICTHIEKTLNIIALLFFLKSAHMCIEKP
jgi:hypothetical protein